MMQQKDITVVISTHNLEAYILNCLLQLEAQTLQNFAVLAVDDCSNDRTAEILQTYLLQAKFPMQIVSTPHNLGKGGLARNYAMDSGLLQSKYVIFLDGDDNIEPHFLECLYTAAESLNADITLCAYDRFEEETGKVLCKEMQNFPPVIDLPRQDDLLAFINSSFWNKLLRWEVIKEERMPDISVGEDLCCFLKICGHCRRIACVNEILIHYRVHKGSCISNTKEEMIDAFSAELQEILQNSNQNQMEEVVSLITFIHIGISMAMRAYENESIEMKAFLKKNKAFLKANGLLGKRKFLSLSSLLRHGFKGLAVWCCKVFYKINMMGAFLWTYELLKKVFHIDVKF